MHRVTVICPENSLYLQFWKGGGFYPACQVFFTHSAGLLETLPPPARHPPASCLQAIMRLQKPIKFASCVVNRVLI